MVIWTEIANPFEIVSIIIHEAAFNQLTDVPLEQIQPYISNEIWHLLERKREAKKVEQWEEAKTLERKIRNPHNRTNSIMDSMSQR